MFEYVNNKKRLTNIYYLLGFLYYKYDQLTIERRAGRAFTMFKEGAINFMPTYKYDAGTNQYDSR